MGTIIILGTTRFRNPLNTKVNTTILADSGQTIVIGGLLDEQVIESVSKVPWLGDIPWIGNLFKSTSSSTKKRNLMVFIKPTIIRDNASIRGVSNRKYSLMRAHQHHGHQCVMKFCRPAGYVFRRYPFLTSL